MTGPAEQRAHHRRAVESDYNNRVDEWVTIYEGRTFHDWAIRVRLERTAALLDAFGIVGPALDVGCGGGQLVALMAHRGLQVSGTDLAGGMVTATNERLAHEGLVADIRQGAADDLPFDDATFGVVTALGLVEYVDEPVRALTEMARVLAPGGHLVVSAPNPVRLAYLLDPVGALMGRWRTPPAGYRRHYWTPRGLRRALGQAGFDVRHLEGHGLGPLMFAGRPLLSDPRSIAVSQRLQASLPAAWSTWLGSNLIAVAGRR